MQKPFKIYRSSAGSGKTYTLAREYLSLALRSPDYFKSILALTFTNKAMQEMKDRIISYLDAFAKGKPHSMAEELRDELGLSAARFQERSEQVLRQILHNYSNFAITTIDAFFQKVIKSFARELGLYGHYRLELDQDLVLSLVIDNLLLRAGSDKQLTQWLTDFAVHNVNEGNSWDIRRDIASLASEIFKEDFQNFENRLSTDKKVKRDLGAYIARLNALIRGFDAQMQAIGEEALKVMEENNLQLSDFAYGRSGVINYFHRLIARDYDPKTRATEAMDKPGLWVGKNSLKKELVREVVETRLNDLLKSAIHYYHENIQSYQSAVQVRSFMYTYGLLADLRKELQEYKGEHDLMLISDAVKLLKKLVEETDTPFVYEKVGSFFQHFLIDEFQDTSRFQWDSLKPLVDNSLAQHARNMIVGDVKQSIYRWRSGDWELLLSGMDQYGGEITEYRHLETNYRSEERIVAFNNALFQALPDAFLARITEKIKGNGTPEIKSYLEKRLQELPAVYRGVVQKTPRMQDKQEGFVQVNFIESEEERSWKTKVLEHIPELLEELQDRGIGLRDIAFLVRRNGEGAEIVRAIMAYKSAGKNKPGYHYEVISNESLFLDASKAVKLLLNILKYLLDPSDRVVQANMLFLYRSYVLDEQESYARLFASVVLEQQLSHYLPRAFVESRGDLTQLPLYELVEWLIDQFQLNTKRGDYAYLQAFQDMLLKFTSDEQLDIASFLDWWEQQGRKESIQSPEDLNAARILTVHKAKGLQFKSVIIPFCHWKTDHETFGQMHIIWGNSEQEPFCEGPYPLKYEGTLRQTVFWKDYVNELVKVHIDNLNLLYVAFTRAEHNLWIFAPGEKIKDTVAGPLHDVLGNCDFPFFKNWSEVDKQFEYGNRNFRIQEEPAPALTEPVALKAYAHYDWRNRITVKKVGAAIATQEVRAKINYGILLHGMLSRITQRSDLDLVLKEYRTQGDIPIEDYQKITEKLNALLDHPVVAPFFSRDMKVMNERSILYRGREYRPDRVVICQNKTMVIDYKTGKPEAKHREQVNAYCQLLRQMNYPNVEGSLLYIEDVLLEKIV